LSATQPIRHATRPAASNAASSRLDALVTPAVIGLTLIALALRLAQIDQSLYGDEILTFDIVTSNGLGGVLETVHDTSVTPPLHYVLAWIAVQVGDPTVWIRVPSLILGTATVPLTYVLGRRTIGAAPGVVAAAFVALSPFAIFYSLEARAYATLMFFVALSTLALVSAMRTGSFRWWVVYAMAGALVLYTHYTGIFAIAAQAVWAFWVGRDRLREVVPAHAAIALLYLPWIPSFLNQRQNEGIKAIEFLADPLGPKSVATYYLTVVAGQPFVALRDLPGRIALAVLLSVIAVALLALVLRQGRDRWPRLPREGLLLVLATAATPVGVVAYSLGGADLLLPRNLGAALPATALVIAWLLTSLGRLPAAAAIMCVLLALGVGTVGTFSDDHRRPPAEEAARYVESVARPADALVFSETAGDLHAYSGDRVRTFRGVADPRGWRFALRGGGRVLVVRPHFGFFAYAPKPPGGLERRFRLESRRVFPAFQPLAVLVYGLTREGDAG
jgi:4-amino-4-deoxy-L-arabinose transferase-like glycosyltransferase